MEKLHPFLQSSQDPTKVGNSVRGLVMLLAAPMVIGLIHSFFGVAITADQIAEVADDVARLAQIIAVIIGSIWTAYGLMMKLVARINRMILWLSDWHEKRGGIFSSSSQD